MKGLLLKDILGMKSFFKFFLIVVVICTAISIGAGRGDFSAGIATSVSVFIGGMMGFTSFAYDTAYGWDQYVLTLPYTKKQIVLAKYVFSLLITGIGAGIGLVANLIIAGVGASQGDAYADTVIALLLCMVVMFISLMIPLMFRYGVEKARIIVIIIFIVPFMLLALLGGQNGADGMQKTIEMILPWMPFAAAAALVVSWFCSVRIYERKGA